MPTIISIHSFRGGTGKSNTTANLAFWMSQAGRRVGVIDTDIQSPGIHVLFGVNGRDITHSLNDYLWNNCEIGEAVRDVTPDGSTGKIFLIPSSIQAGEIVDILRQGYEITRLTAGFRQLIDELDLDILLIDTHPGLNEETLFSIAISHALLVILRPDQQDYEGTAVTVDVARSLEVPQLQILVNKAPDILDLDAVKSRVEEAYGASVAAVLPLNTEMAVLASESIFSARFPEHSLSQQFKHIAHQLMTSSAD